jgi:hypothetical protein
MNIVEQLKGLVNPIGRDSDPFAWTKPALFAWTEPAL